MKTLPSFDYKDVLCFAYPTLKKLAKQCNIDFEKVYSNLCNPSEPTKKISLDADIALNNYQGLCGVNFKIETCATGETFPTIQFFKGYPKKQIKKEFSDFAWVYEHNADFKEWLKKRKPNAIQANKEGDQ